MSIQLLLRDADGPIIPDDVSLADLVVPQQRSVEQTATFLGDPGGDPNDLAAQRWGIVLPEGADHPAILEALRPLLEAREREQGAPVREPYLVPAGLSEKGAEDWVEDYEYTDEPEEERPRYLLLVGDLDAIPASLQRALAAVAWVGRITGTLDELTQYAQKAAAEANAGTPTIHVFPVIDGTEATRVARDAWMTPITDQLRAKGSVAVPDAERWSAADLADRSGVLITSSHGHHAGADGDFRTLQGAPHLGTDELLTPERIRSMRFMPGGLWLPVACHGGGMVTESVYRPWMHRLYGETLPRRLDAALSALSPDGRPFVSGVVRAAIGHDAGPLGVIAHVDTAWTWAFKQATRSSSRPKTLLDLLHAASRGRRLGVIHRVLVDRCRHLDDRLDRLARKAQRDRDTQVDRDQEAQLRLMRADLGGYLLFGDPAATVQA